MILDWSQFISESLKYDFKSKLLNKNFQEAKVSYEQLYVNMIFEDITDGDGGKQFFEFIGQDSRGWWLLDEQFDAIDEVYPTYEELASIHGTMNFKNLKNYDIKGFQNFSEVEDMLRGFEENPNFSRNEFVQILSDLIDSELFEFNFYEIAYIESNLTKFYHRKDLKPKSSKLCYFIELKVLSNDTILKNHEDFYSNNIDLGVKMFPILKSIQSVCEDSYKLDMLYKFDGRYLKLLFIQND